MRLLPLALLALVLQAQPAKDAKSAAEPQRIRLTMERQGAQGWSEVNSALVFGSGDRVRFRISANFPGYLYVMNQGTGGSYELLFPRSDTGSDNQMASSKDYIVPATQGAFTVAGPPGQDVMYWLVTPVDLGRQYRPLPPPPPPGPVPPSMRPRCDDSMLKARGECIDGTAGVMPVKPSEKLPGNLSGISGGTPRELLFMQDQGGVVLSSRSPLTGPVIYELRLAHQ
jgi:hypothetical protein